MLRNNLASILKKASHRISGFQSLNQEKKRLKIPMANLLFNMMRSFAKFERSLIRERQKERIAPNHDC